MPDKIMIIRHADKPVPGHVKGVRQSGRDDADSLSVRGWQRAGALIRFFRHPDAPLISVPTHLIAAGFEHGATDRSRRSRQTLIPLSHAMAMPIDDRFTKHQEVQAAEYCLSLDGVVLIAWHHECIPTLASAIAPNTPVPASWPDDCFDRVWVFERARDGWRFQQVPQRLLAGDAETAD